MSGMLRTAGTTMLAVAALPVAGIAALVGLFTLMQFLLGFGTRSFGDFLTFVICALVVFFSLRFAWRTWKKSEQFVLEMNRQQGLQLMPNMLLGAPAPAFMAFDRENRKIAVCNAVTGDCRVEEFSHVLGWRYEWRNADQIEIAGVGGTVRGSPMMTPLWEKTERRTGFEVIVEVSDPGRPELRFPMFNESQASQWCARLDAIFNGQ